MPCARACAVAYAAGMRVALCQLPISPEPAINLDRITEAVASAARQGADLAVFPEATQARFGSDLRAAAEDLVTEGRLPRERAEAAVAEIGAATRDGRFLGYIAMFIAAGRVPEGTGT